MFTRNRLAKLEKFGIKVEACRSKIISKFEALQNLQTKSLTMSNILHQLAERRHQLREALYLLQPHQNVVGEQYRVLRNAFEENERRIEEVILNQRRVGGYPRSQNRVLQHQRQRVRQQLNQHRPQGEETASRAATRRRAAH